MIEGNHPERVAAAKFKYYPPGHKESVARLEDAWRDARVEAYSDEVYRLLEEAPPDVLEAIDKAANDGVNITVDNPYKDYLAAAQVDASYNRKLRDEKELAREYFERLAEPLLPDPPVDQWGSIEVIGETGVSSLRVPFIRPELEAISKASAARAQLLEVGRQQSGAEREFWMKSQHFPTEAPLTPRSGGLTQRPSAIWGIMTAARAAEDALTDFAGTAWEPRGAAVGQLVIVRDLPDKLIRHKPPTAK